MNHAYPALFLFGPADGKRMFVDGRAKHHDVVRQEPASITFQHYHARSMHAPVLERVTYTEVDRIEGIRIFAPAYERYCPGEIRQRLIAGYQGEARC